MTIRTVERIVLIAGLLLIGTWAAVRVYGFIGSRAALMKLHAEMDAPRSADAPSDSIDSDSAFDANTPVDFRLWSIQRVRAYRKTLTEDPDDAIAVLKIPTVGLEAPLFNGTDDPMLDRGLGRIRGTAEIGQAGNIGIAGHRDGFFRGLKDVKLGDPIELDRPKFSDEYVVSRIQIVAPDNVKVLDPTPTPVLTLVTCYPFYYVGDAPQRYIVTAMMTSSVQRLHTTSGAFGSQP